MAEVSAAAPAATPARRRVVVALGGNAAYPPTIKGTAEEQLALMRQVCAHLVDIIRAGWQLTLTHGNGPVVGNILYRMARTADEFDGTIREHEGNGSDQAGSASGSMCQI